MQAPPLTWKVLSVDSTDSVSEAIKRLLEKLVFLDRSIEVLKASDFEQAEKIIEQTNDIAVVLIEIMSETKNRGVKFIHDLRYKYHNPKIRIILRTGYPDALPNKQDIQNYEIDGYMPKELNPQVQIEITLMTAIRTYHKFQVTERTLMALAGSIAHETRNSMDTMSLTAEFAAEKINNQNALENINSLSGDLQLIQDIAKNGCDMINILLSNLRSQEIDRSQFKSLSIAECSRDALKLYSFKAGEQNRVSLYVQNDFIFWGSDILFHYLLFNLLKNALIYISEKPELTINITITSNANERSLYFKDSGVGISPGQIDLLFNDFVSINKANGTGLGLAFCKRVMQSFEGTISCTSQLGQGAEFKLSFPVVKTEQLTLKE